MAGNQGIGAWPRLGVRVVDGRSVVDIANAEILFEGGAIRALGEQLHRLMEGGHTRLLLNFGGVRHMSSDVLGVLAGLHRRLERVQGRLGLYGCGAELREMVRICRLEQVFDLYADEGEALGARSTEAMGELPRASRAESSR